MIFKTRSAMSADEGFDGLGSHRVPCCTAIKCQKVSPKADESIANASGERYSKTAGTLTSLLRGMECLGHATRIQTEIHPECFIQTKQTKNMGRNKTKKREYGMVWTCGE